MAAVFGRSKSTNKRFGDNPTHMSKTTPPHSESDADVLEALRAAAEHDQRDLADGGVTPKQIASHSTLAAKTLADRLPDIDEASRVRGLNPETKEPRWTWLPAEEVTDDWP